jgi:WD40 repeat protein
MRPIPRVTAGLLLASLWAIAGLAASESDPSTRRIQAHDAPVYDVALSPSARFLATASFDGTIRVFRSADGSLQQTWRGHEGRVLAVAFAGNGAQLVSGGADGTVRVWPAAASDTAEDAATGDTASAENPPSPPPPPPPLTGHEGAVHAVVVADTGRLAVSAGADKTVASAGADNLIRLWKTDDGTEIRTLEGHSEGVLAVGFGENGRPLVSGGWDRTLRLWNPDSGESLGVLPGQPGWIMDLAIVPNEARAVAVDLGGHLLFWDLKNGAEVDRRKLDARVLRLAVSADGRLCVMANEDGTCLLLDLRAR